MASGWIGHYLTVDTAETNTSVDRLN